MRSGSAEAIPSSEAIAAQAFDFHHLRRRCRRVAVEVLSGGRVAPQPQRHCAPEKAKWEGASGVRAKGCSPAPFECSTRKEQVQEKLFTREGRPTDKTPGLLLHLRLVPHRLNNEHTQSGPPVHVKLRTYTWLSRSSTSSPLLFLLRLIHVLSPIPKDELAFGVKACRRAAMPVP